MKFSWHDRFDTEEYIYGEEPNPLIVEQIERLRGCNKVVAFAEGEGRNAVFLAREGFDVTAYDLAESGLKKTEKLAEKHGVTVMTKKVDLIRDEVEANEFDAAIMVFGHFREKDQKNVFGKLLKAVKPGGIILMEVYSKEQLNYKTGGPDDRDMLYDPKNILEWCKRHHVLHFFYGEQIREEGSRHTGLAHVVQLVLKK